MPKKMLLPVLMMASFAVGIARPARAEDRNAALHDAMTASGAWLKLLDDGQYAASWQQAGSFFRDHITSDAWARQIAAVRQPLGAMKSRKFKAAQYATQLPGAPAGQYVVIQYDTDYANKADAVETVTPMLDKDGKWRVSGYYIR